MISSDILLIPTDVYKNEPYAGFTENSDHL